MTQERILRVFVGRTNFTPNDSLVAIGLLAHPSLQQKDFDEMHISPGARIPFTQGTSQTGKMEEI